MIRTDTYPESLPFEAGVCEVHASEIDAGAAWFCAPGGELLMGSDEPDLLKNWQTTEGMTSNIGAVLELRITYAKGSNDEHDVDLVLTRQQAVELGRWLSMFGGPHTAPPREGPPA